MGVPNPATVSVQDFVDVTLTIAPLSVPYQLFGVPLVIGDSGIIDTTERVRTYSSITGVGADFGDSAPEYLAAEVFFEQSPQPATCMIGSWARTAIPGLLNGAILTPTEQLLANFTVVSSGSFFIIIDGVPHAITGCSFSSALNLNGVASAIQTQLPAGVTCTWNSVEEWFTVTSSTTGVASSVSFASAPTAVGNFVFASTGPATTNTISINGVSIEFITSGATGNEVNIGGSPTTASTLAALLTFLQSSTNTSLNVLGYATDATHLYIYDLASGVGGDSIPISVGTCPNATASGADLAGATGTDISTLLGMQSTDGGYTAPGLAAESALAAVTACANVSNQWYGLAFAASVMPTTTDYEAIANYIQASPRARIFGITTQNTGVLNSAISSDIASIMESLNLFRTLVMYSSSNPYAAMTIFGRAFTVDFLASNSTLTVAWKQAPGIIGENLTESQFEAMVGKNCSAVINVNNGATMIWNAAMSNGYWFDEVHNCDWYTNYVQTNLFNALYTTPTKIPQTNAGNNILLNIMNNSAVAAVNNGMVAPGQWNGPPIGAITTGAMLPAGFYTYAPDISTQAQASRDARASVPFQQLLKLAGAIQTVVLGITVNR